jgi:hypothetical protein
MVELRRRGVAGVVICSESFLGLAQGQAQNLGDPDLPLAVIAHPLGGLVEDEVRGRAAQAVPGILAVLRGGAS